MKLSTRSRYGTRMLLDMAQYYEGSPVQLGTIAKRQGIPIKYLEQIIIPLKKAGYIKSIRGSKGGYRLSRPPGEITVGEIVTLLEGGFRLTECSKNSNACERAGHCPTRRIWMAATEAMCAKLDSITLADLLEPQPITPDP